MVVMVAMTAMVVMVAMTVIMVIMVMIQATGHSIVDRCVMYKAGHDEGCAAQLGGDEGFVEKASKYFGGAMMEARRFLGTVPEDGDDEEGEDEAAESSDSN